MATKPRQIQIEHLVSSGHFACERRPGVEPITEFATDQNKRGFRIPQAVGICNCHTMQFLANGHQQELEYPTDQSVGLQDSDRDKCAGTKSNPEAAAP